VISAKPQGGTGMLAVFCDLDAQWHKEFREWLVQDMIPARFRIGGFPHCASYDAVPGQKTEPFVTVYETDTIGTLYGAPYQGLRGSNRDARDQAFHARLIKPARYTLAWVGPELARKSGAPFATVAAFDRFDLAPGTTEAFNIWYLTEYLPRLEAIPAVSRVRRYLAMEGAPRHVVMHEIEDAAALESKAWAEARSALAKALGPQSNHVSGSYSRVLGASAPAGSASSR